MISFFCFHLTGCLSVLDFWNVNLRVYYKLEKNWFQIKLDFYCPQKSISKSNWFFNFLYLIIPNWKKSSDNPYFKNQVEIDMGIDWLNIFPDSKIWNFWVPLNSLQQGWTFVHLGNKVSTPTKGEKRVACLRVPFRSETSKVGASGQL